LQQTFKKESPQGSPHYFFGGGGGDGGGFILIGGGGFTLLPLFTDFFIPVGGGGFGAFIPIIYPPKFFS
jgi:hypothetical protein